MNYIRLSRRAVAGVLALLAGRAMAADYHWIKAGSLVDGAFSDSAHWLGGPTAPPGLGDAAWLDLTGQAPSITMAASVSNTRLVVERCSPALQLDSGVTYTLTNAPASDPSIVVDGAGSLSFRGQLASNDAVIGLTNSGTMTLEAIEPGVGSTWVANGLVSVGKQGAASLFLNDGSTLTCQQLSAGFGASATAEVFAADSMLTVAGQMTIGTEGQAGLNIDGSGQVKANTAVFGLLSPSVAGVTADLSIGGTGLPAGAHSLEVTHALYLGLNGSTTANLVGGSVRAGSLAIGGSTTGLLGNGTGQLWLNGATVKVDTLIQVGVGGKGALVIQPDSALTSQTAIVSDAVPSIDPDVVNPTVIMEGGSSWINTGDFTVGEAAGTTASVQVAQGSGMDPTLLTTGTLAVPSQATIGYHGVGSLDVMDSGSVWTHHGSLYVGRMPGSAGTLNVLAGGRLVTDDLHVAGGGTGDVSISGVGSVEFATFVVNNSATVGGSGAGTLIVWDGGDMQVAGNLSLAVGSDVSSGSVTVSDVDSKLSVAGTVRVGVDGTGTMSVQYGATATTGTILIGTGATALGCMATVSDGASWTSTGGVFVGGDSTGPQGIGSLTVDSATLAAAGPITIWSTGALIANNATLTVPSIQLRNGILSGQGKIAVPVHTTGGEFLIDDALTLNLAGPLTSDGNSILSKTAAGTLVISGTQTHGPASTFRVLDGELKLLTDAGSASSANLQVEVTSPGSLLCGTTQHLRQLTVGAGATATVLQDAKATLIVHGLSINGTGEVDLQNNDMVWAYGSTADAYGKVRGWINTGKAGTGGLVTGIAGPGVALAPVPNSLLHILSWEGQTISDGIDYNQIVVKFTYLGDVNLDGKVDSQDLLNVIAHQGQNGTWFDGDVDLDGIVTPLDSDIVALHMNAGTGGANGLPLLSQWTAATDSPLVVPEPGTLGVLAMAIGGLLVRRRR